MKVNYIALAIPVFFVLIGAELFAARLMRRSVYRFDDAVTDLGCGIGQQAVAVLLKGSLVLGYAVVYERFTLVRFADGSILPWLIAFVGVDFAYYWWHRLSHEVSFMWAIHVVHHQSEDYNLAVALRQAWFSGISSWPFYLPLAFVGVPPLVFFTIASFSTLYQFWIHTRLVGKLGPLELVINTPSHHRVHHGRDEKYLDRNYAATLIVWDRMFGSFEEEREEPRYGTVEAYGSWNSVWANFDFWRELVRRARATPRLADKIRVFLKPPGWMPPGLEGGAHGSAEEPAVRYVTSSPWHLKAYVVAQFVPVVLGTSALMTVGDDLSFAWLAGGVALVVASLLVWGGLFEGKWWAVPLEVLRLVALACVATALAWGTDYALPAGALSAVAAAAFAVWAFGYRQPLAGRRAAEMTV